MAKALKGTKTEGNLKDAFAGESQANRRYLYFANKADVEGQNDVSAVFRSTAEGEALGLEVVAQHGDEDAARLRTQQLDQVGEVGFMQRQRQLADFGGVALIDGRGDGMQEIGADRARFVAQFDLARGVLHGLSDRRVLSFPMS